VSGYFIAGTDTGVGKTRVTCGLLAALRDFGVQAAGMKPVAAGESSYEFGNFNEDVVNIAAVTGQNIHDPALCCYRLAEPLSPHISALNAGISIHIDAIQAAFDELRRRYQTVLVEGAGGWLTPINEHQTMADAAAALNLPIILVVGLRLGCLNHALLTSLAIRQRGLWLAGWVGNQIDPEFRALGANVETLTARLNSSPLALLPYDPAGTLHHEPLRAAATILRPDRSHG
jgi:dethiobiotin synthetase